MRIDLFFPLISSFVFLLCIQNLNANVITAVSDGLWHASSTWDNGIPMDNDGIIVPAGRTVTINQHVNLSNVQIELYGTITFTGGKKITLSNTGAIYIISPGIIIDENNGNKIIIDSDLKWAGGDGDIVGDRAITTNSNPANSPNFQTPVPPSQLLPVHLISFEARLLDAQVVEISWKTASEYQNHYFELQRSNNASDWETIAKVAGKINSSQQHNYIAKDLYPKSGLNYYRLKQNDIDGQYHYSKLVVIKNNISHEIAYPNPTYDQINFKFSFIPNSVHTSVKVFNAKGQCILEHQVNSSEASLDVNQYEDGVYYYQIVSGNSVLKNGIFVKN